MISTLNLAKSLGRSITTFGRVPYLLSVEIIGKGTDDFTPLENQRGHFLVSRSPNRIGCQSMAYGATPLKVKRCGVLLGSPPVPGGLVMKRLYTA